MDNADQPDFFSPRTLDLLSKPLEDPQTYRAQMLVRICELEAELSAMRRAHNDASLMLRLPAEIFTKVFKELTIPLSYAAAPTRGRCRDPRQKGAWLRQVNVCHRWRERVLSCGDLWSSLLLTRADLTQEMVVRSGASPLHVDLVAGYEYSDDAALRVALSQTQRLQSVCLTTSDRSPDGWLADILHPLTHRELPILENLSLKALFSQHPSLDLKLLAQRAPSLQRLVLQNSMAPWNDITPGSNMVELQLRQTIESTNRPSWRDFLTHLGDMSRLKTLDLKGVLPVGPHLPSALQCSPLHPTLPCIESLRLFDLAESTTHFFQSVTYPMTALIDVSFWKSRDTNAAVFDAFDFSFGSFKSLVFRQLQIRSEVNVALFGFSFWSKAVKAWGSDYQLKVKPDRSIEFHNFTNLPNLPQQLALAILGQYDLTPIETLRVHGDMGLTGQEWATIFSPMNQTRSILGSMLSIQPLIQAIAAPKTFAMMADITEGDPSPGSPSDDPKVHPAIFPSLDNLTFSLSTFGTEHGRESLEYEIAMTQLIEALESRSALLPIPKITFDYCQGFRHSERKRMRDAAKGSIVEWV